MKTEKVYRIIEELKKSGFSMGIEEFYRIAVNKVMKRYGIKESFTGEELLILAKLILDLCEENELKNMNLGYLDRMSGRINNSKRKKG